MATQATSNGLPTQNTHNAELLQKFQNLLEIVSNQETSAQDRRKGEESLAEARGDNGLLYLECLLQVLIGSDNEQVRQLAGLLFRQSVEPNSEVLSKISSQSWPRIQSGLMTAIRKEESKIVYFTICDCIGTFGSRILPDGGWPSLLPDLLQLTQNNDQNNNNNNNKQNQQYHKQGFLRVLKSLGEYAISYLNQHLQKIHELLNNALQDNNTEVQIEAFAAFASLIQSLQDENIIKNFEDTMKMSLNIFKIEDDRTIQLFMEELLGLTDHRPTIIEPYLNELVSGCVSIINNNKAEFETRQLCLEELLDICHVLGIVVRKNKNFCNEMLKILFLFCAEYNDELDFNDPCDDDEQSFIYFGKSGFENVSETLGAKVYFDSSKEIIKQWLSSNNWKHVYSAICCLIKGIPVLKELDEMKINKKSKAIEWNKGDFMKNISDEETKESSNNNNDNKNKNKGNVNSIGFIDRVILTLCNLVVKHDKNEVKHNALIALNIFSAELDVEFHEKYYHLIYNIIGNILSQYDKFHFRIVLQTIRLLAQFNADCSINEFKPYCDDILQCLRNILTSNNNNDNNNNNNNDNKNKKKEKYSLQEECCIAVATCSKLLGNNFVTYYDVFFQIMVNKLEKCKDGESQSLRGRAMECIGIMGESVGNMRFSQDAHKLMKVLLPMRNELQRQNDNSAYKYLNHLFARIGRIIGNDFIEYFDNVIPHILQSAQVEAATVGKVDDPNPIDPNIQVVTVHMRGVGDSKLLINAISLDEKADACHMLYQFCKDHPIGYFPYLLKTAEILIPLMRYPYSPRIRVASNAISPLILKSAISVMNINDNNNRYKQLLIKNENNFKQDLYDLHDTLLGGLLQALVLERDVSEQVPLLEILTKFIAITHESNGFWKFTDKQLMEIAEDLDILFSESFERRKDIAQRFGTKGNENGGGGSGSVFNNNNNNDKKVDHKIESEICLLSDIEENLISGCIDVVEWCFRTCGERFSPYFDKSIANNAKSLLECNQEWQNSQFNQFEYDTIQMKLQGLCLMIDCIELGGQYCHEKYLKWFFPYLEQSCNSDDPETKQTSFFAIGVLASLNLLPNAHNVWLKQFRLFCNEFKHRMNSQESEKQQESKLSHVDDDDDDDNDIENMYGVYENGVSAMGKIIRYMPLNDKEKTIEYIDEWIKHLPIQKDEDEAPVAFDNILWFIQKYGADLVKNVERVQRICYTILLYLSSFASDPNRFLYVMQYDFDDDVKKHLIKIPLLDKKRSIEAYKLIDELKKTISQSAFENVEKRFSAQERHNRDIIRKIHGLS